MKKGEKMDNARLGILDEKLENLATQSIQLSLYHKNFYQWRSYRKNGYSAERVSVCMTL